MHFQAKSAAASTSNSCSGVFSVSPSILATEKKIVEQTEDEEDDDDDSDGVVEASPRRNVSPSPTSNVRQPPPSTPPSTPPVPSVPSALTMPPQTPDDNTEPGIGDGARPNGENEDGDIEEHKDEEANKKSSSDVASEIHSHQSQMNAAIKSLQELRKVLLLLGFLRHQKTVKIIIHFFHDCSHLCLRERSWTPNKRSWMKFVLFHFLLLI